MPKIHRDRPPTNRFTDPVLEPPQPPAASAFKDEWVAYAKALGIDSTGTKVQIMARVD